MFNSSILIKLFQADRYKSKLKQQEHSHPADDTPQIKKKINLVLVLCMCGIWFFLI